MREEYPEGRKCVAVCKWTLSIEEKKKTKPEDEDLRLALAKDNGGDSGVKKDEEVEKERGSPSGEGDNANFRETDDISGEGDVDKSERKKVFVYRVEVSGKKVGETKGKDVKVRHLKLYKSVWQELAHTPARLKLLHMLRAEFQGRMRVDRLLGLWGCAIRVVRAGRPPTSEHKLSRTVPIVYHFR